AVRQAACQAEHASERVDGGGSDHGPEGTRDSVGDDPLENLTENLTGALGAVRTLGFEVTAGAQVVPEFRGCDGPVVGQVVEGSVVLPDELAAWAPPGGAADHQGGAVRVRGRRGGDGSGAAGPGAMFARRASRVADSRRTRLVIPRSSS